MKLTWSPEALQDLGDIRAYISQDGPRVAKKVVARIVTLVNEPLSSNPGSGRPGPVAGTRELVISNTPFVIPYRARDGKIDILRVYHGSRMWPEIS
ncbi:MAG: type II toxin-antitoxin system RelE/ParE family toxin [Proteobacteria bacterium]|nr:type II toxin-antitoxin system RelE/ParE family toxin [Pseudomonadota bacterium]